MNDLHFFMYTLVLIFHNYIANIPNTQDGEM